MEMTPYVQALQNDLAAVAAVGGVEEHETVRRLAAALESSLRLRLLDVVADVANELTAQLPDGRVDVRLAAGDPTLVFVASEPERPSWPTGDEKYSARITLRLPDALKSSIESAARREGVSVNAWLVQALARSVETRPSRGRRLSGFARS